MSGLLNWWDGVELWIIGLPFILQVLVVMPIFLAVAAAIARIADATLAWFLPKLRRTVDAVISQVKMNVRSDSAKEGR